MDHRKRLGKNHGSTILYMDLKEIVRVHALPFLPAKSALRSQGVCRDWKLQMSSPFFTHNQSHSFRSVSGLFYQTVEAPPLFISFDPNSYGVPDPSLSFLPEPVDVRSSSGGLLCCQSRTGDRPYYICNPVTKQWKKLPRPNADHGSKPATVLVFEPSLLNFSAEFKIVCPIKSSDFDDAIEFEIYSSADNSWKVSGDICFLSQSISPESGIHVDNVIYWKLQRGSNLLSFNVAKERSDLLRDYGICNFNGILGNKEGKICSASLDHHERGVNVYVPSNVHHNTMNMTTYHEPSSYRHRNLHLRLNQEILTRGDPVEIMLVTDDLLVLRAGKKVYSMYMKTEEIKQLMGNVAHGGWCVPYVNSLVSI